MAAALGKALAGFVPMQRSTVAAEIDTWPTGRPTRGGVPGIFEQPVAHQQACAGLGGRVAQTALSLPLGSRTASPFSKPRMRLPDP